MKLYTIIQKQRQEVEQNVRNAQTLKVLIEASQHNPQFEKEREARLAQVRALFESNQIDINQVYTLNTLINREINEKRDASTAYAQKEYATLLAPKSKYSNMITALLDSRAVISNKMLCAMLGSAKERWQYHVQTDISANSVTLVFESSQGEYLRAVRALSKSANTPLNLQYHEKRLENINWFNMYLTSVEKAGNLVYKASGYAPGVMPKRIQTVLEDFFKFVNVNEAHPQTLCFDEAPICAPAHTTACAPAHKSACNPSHNPACAQKPTAQKRTPREK